jgi:hypothetical protein
MTQPQLNQSNRHGNMPYVTVATDERGSACWFVVEGEKRTKFMCGKEAFHALGLAIKRLPGEQRSK